MEMNFMNPKQLKETLVRKKGRPEWGKDLALKVASQVIDLRIRHGLTQAKLAKRCGTKQPCIARLENGSLPSLSFLKRIADSVGEDIIINIV